MNQNSRYHTGVIYIVIAGVFLSFGGLFVRYLHDANPWTVLFYRSLSFSVTVVMFMFLREGIGFTRRFRTLQRADMIVAISLAIGFIAYVLSLFNTSVANTVLVISTGPVFAALLGWVVLREVVSPGTWIAIIAAIAGVAIMVSGGVASGDLSGLLYALLAVVAFAAMVVTLRTVSAGRDMMASTALAGIIAALFCLFFIPTFQISVHDLMLSLAMGSIQVGCGFILITLGSRSVPAAQIPLLALSETALSPLWVWLMVNETPARNTLIGGGVVLLAVVFQSASGIRAHRRIASGVANLETKKC